MFGVVDVLIYVGIISKIKWYFVWFRLRKVIGGIGDGLLFIFLCCFSLIIV